MPFDWADPLLLNEELSEQERMVRDSARDYCQDKLASRVKMGFRNETFDRAIMTEMGAMGFLGCTLPEQYGGGELNYTCYGLVAREVERVDSGYRSAMSVQSSLAMYPIYAFGAEEQRQRWLPKMATGELIGCFGLTEADGGSDPGSMKTKAEKVAGGYRLNGAKYWITNSPVADLAVVWAKLDGDIRGFVVERGGGSQLAAITRESADIELLAGDASAAAELGGEACRLYDEVGDKAFLSTAAGTLAQALYALDVP